MGTPSDVGDGTRPNVRGETASTRSDTVSEAQTVIQRPGTRHLATMNLLLENLSDGVVLIDNEGHIIDANETAERLFGEAIPIGVDIAYFSRHFRIMTVDGGTIQPDQLPIMRALNGDAVHGAELALQRPDGSRRYVSVNAHPVTVRDGMRGVLILLNDIGHRVRRDKQAEAFRALSQQLASLELDLDSVCRTVVMRIGEITPTASIRLLLNDPAAKRLRLAASCVAGHLVPGNRSAVNSDIATLAARTRLPVVIPDFSALPPTEMPGHAAHGSAVAMPLIARGELIGVLASERPEPHSVDESELAFIDMMAAQSAMAIHNATMFQQRNHERALLTKIIKELPAGLAVFEVVRLANRRADFRVAMRNSLAEQFLPPALLARQTTRLRRLMADVRVARLVFWLEQALEKGELVLGEEMIGDDAPHAVGHASYWNGAIVPLADRSGHVTELVLLATNITEQVATRNRIEELVRVAGTRAAELEAIVSSMTDPVTVCGASGHIRLANRAALETYGVSSLTELSTSPNIVDHIQLRDTEGRTVARDERPHVRALRGETVHEDYTLYHHGLARDVFRRASAAPVRDAAGEIVGSVLVEADITSLIEVDRLKDEFFSVAAHELRTPLTAMKGYVQILARQLQNEADPLVPRALATLQEQSERMERLINELLDFARIESRQLELRYRELDLVALLEQITSDVTRLTRLHRITVLYEMPELRGRWDPDRLAQVFGNLLNNAVKYSPEGGAILVRVTLDPEQPEWVNVAITDNGIGIPHDQLPRLFARYSRVRDARRDQPAGLGLGLYITREIVEAHAGKITVHSTLGVGSTFTVYLPRQPRIEPPPPPPPDRARTRPL